MDAADDVACHVVGAIRVWLGSLEGERCAISGEVIVRFTSWIVYSMKLLIAIVQNYDSNTLLTALTDQGFRATRITSIGGFLRSGNTTVLMGVEDDRIDECIEILRRSCRSRVEVKIDPESPELAEWFAAGVHEVTVGGAVLFIVPISRVVRIPVPGQE